MKTQTTQSYPVLTKVIDLAHPGLTKQDISATEKAIDSHAKVLKEPPHLVHHSGNHLLHKSISNSSKDGNHLGKQKVHGKVSGPSSHSEPIKRLISEPIQRVITDLDDQAPESSIVTTKAIEALSEPATGSAVTPTRVIEAKNGARPSQEFGAAKEVLSSENSDKIEAAKAITDSDDGSDSVTISAKVVDTKGGAKSSSEPNVGKETVSSESSEATQVEKPPRKERAESVISLEQPSVGVAPNREGARPNGASPGTPMEIRADFGKDTTSASRRDFHGSSMTGPEGTVLTSRPGTELAQLLNAEIGSFQGDASPGSVWNVDHFAVDALTSQAELQGSPPIQMEGSPQTILQAGDSSNLKETLAVTSPLWGAFFLQSLGRLRPRPIQPTIMVVEGDEKTRDKLIMSFAKQGYLVLSAPTTHDAMGLLRAPLSPLDVVVVNLNLPDLSGLHLCTYLRKSNPGLDLIVYSDEAEPAELRQLRKLGVTRFLQNPFSVEELVADVNSILH